MSDGVRVVAHADCCLRLQSGESLQSTLEKSAKEEEEKQLKEAMERSAADSKRRKEEVRS